MVEINGKAKRESINTPKLPLRHIPPQFTEGLAAALLHGASKYETSGQPNWMHGFSWEGVMDSLLRHLSAFRKGEELDDGPKGSGLPHLFHAATNLMFLTYFAHGPQADEYRKFDDRLFKEGK
jgi:hypothetical protein